MRKAFALLCVLLLAVSVFAQGKTDENYPSRPVEVTVQWAAGGGADLAFRALADVFSQHTGQQMVIKNVPGASGVPGTVQYLDGTRPDGYSLMHWSNAHVSNMHMTNVPFDNDSFRHVAEVVESTHYLLVPADSEWETLDDFIEYAKANPGKIRMGNAGTGGGNHLAALLLEDATGTEFTHVAYDGGNPSVIGLMSGEVDASMNNSPEGYSNVEAGQVRMLVSFGEERLPDFPDVPTAKELGYDIVLRQWRGIAVPLETSDEIVDKLDDIIKVCVEDPAYAEKLAGIGAIPAYMDTEEYNQFIKSEDQRFKDLIVSRGFGDRY